MNPSSSVTRRPPPWYRLMHAAMGPVLNRLGLSCRHFAFLCSAKRDRPLSVGERFRLRLHGFLCGLCRPLPARLDELGHLARETGRDAEGDSLPVTPLDPESAARIRRALEREAGGPPDPDAR